MDWSLRFNALRSNALRFKAVGVAGIAVALATACVEAGAPIPGVSKGRSVEHALARGEHLPAAPEKDTVGAIAGVVTRGSPRFAELVESEHRDIVFKDEEGTGADRLMAPELRRRLHALASRVRREWPDLKLRVTEAWDEDLEHGGQSIHYEGRAADLTLSDLDSSKLGRLARLAVDSGFDWVYYEAGTHVHASVARAQEQ
jgi:hypothetical protein